MKKESSEDIHNEESKQIYLDISDIQSQNVNHTSMQSINLPANNFEAFNFGKNAPPDYESSTRSSKNFNKEQNL